MDPRISTLDVLLFFIQGIKKIVELCTNMQYFSRSAKYTYYHNLMMEVVRENTVYITGELPSHIDDKYSITRAHRLVKHTVRQEVQNLENTFWKTSPYWTYTKIPSFISCVNLGTFQSWSANLQLNLLGCLEHKLKQNSFICPSFIGTDYESSKSAILNLY